MNKAVFLDRDGTINEDYGYVYKIEDLKFISGVIEGLQLLKKIGYKLIIITNQSGIGRGFYNIDDYNKFTKFMLNKLRENSIIIDGIYYCPHVSSDNCNCRKPNLSLFYKAIDDLDIDIDKSYVIGDKVRDLSICEETLAKGILLTDKNDRKYICKKNLYEAAQYIRQQNGSDK